MVSFRPPTDLDRSDHKYDPKFLKRVDIPQKDKLKYLQSLVHDMPKLLKRLKKIETVKGGINVVMIAEKPSVAQVISKVLSKDKVNDFQDDGFCVFEYEDKFHDIKAYFRVLSTYGHIYK